MTNLTEADLRISRSAYEWTGRAISLLRKVLQVDIRLHRREGQLQEGDIFVFNHFARFETFIPQYLIYRETGALSRSIAAPGFFEGNETFRRYLLSLGAVPTTYRGLLPFLAAEVIRGRKVIIFPEGGMVKDHRVLDRRGGYSIYSRIAKERRKQHAGAAVVATAVEEFKVAVREASRLGHEERLLQWANRYGFESTRALEAAAGRPTRIVPCNITFYPIRITQNLLQKAAELFDRDLSPRLVEELLVEGNILLAPTDMDIRLGEPITPAELWSGLDGMLARRVARRAEAPDDFLVLPSAARPWDRTLLDRRNRRNALRIRDAYMARMYAAVTVNLSHLASRIIFRLLDRGVARVEEARLHRTLYLAVKGVQCCETVNLHGSLLNPEAYGHILEGGCAGWTQFLDTAASMGLVERSDGSYAFLPKLREEHGFDEIRLENLVAVYANEVEPIGAVTRCVDRAIAAAPAASTQALARYRFDDELRAFRWDREAFHEERHEEINRQQTATLSGEPFLLLPEAGARRLGVILVHGFTASPAEVRPLADRLFERGYPCLGVRVKGHGTSPWDLAERSWEDWLASVRAGWEILSAFADRLCLVGFSAGGALALRLASERPAGLAGVVAVAAPVRFRDKAMSLVPLVHGANVVVESMMSGRGLMRFQHSNPEHPEVNYRHMPIRALYELGRLVHDVQDRLGEVRCPVLLVQGTGDPTVDPESARILQEGLTGCRKELLLIPAERHGILYEGVGETWAKVLAFLDGLDSG